MSETLEGNGDPVYAIQADSSWSDFVATLNAYHATTTWQRQRLDDGSKPFVPLKLDPVGASRALNRIDTIRKELAERHDPRDVEYAMVNQAQLQLDGVDFQAGLDAERQAPYELFGRPSTTVVRSIRYDSTIDTYRQMIKDHLSGREDLSTTDSRYVLRNVDESRLRGLVAYRPALEQLLLEQGELDAGVRTERLGREIRTQSPFEIRPGQLPAWLNELGGIEQVSIATEVAPLVVRFVSMSDLQEELAYAREDRRELRAHLNEQAQQFIAAAEAEYDELGRDHPFHVRVQRSLAGAGVSSRLARAAASKQPYLDWAEARTALRAKIDGGIQAQADRAFAESATVLHYEHMKEQWTRQVKARAVVLAESGLVGAEVLSMSSRIPTVARTANSAQEFAEGIGQRMAGRVVELELDGVASLARVRDVVKGFENTLQQRGLHAETHGIG